MLKALGPKQVADHHLRNLEHVGRVPQQLLCEVKVLLLLPRGMLRPVYHIPRVQWALLVGSLPGNSFLLEDDGPIKSGGQDCDK